jgi:hypothetical protein
MVRDPIDFGGYIAAEHYALPHATVMWAFYISAKFSCADAVLELRRRYGLPDDPPSMPRWAPHSTGRQAHSGRFWPPSAQKTGMGQLVKTRGMKTLQMGV